MANQFDPNVYAVTSRCSIEDAAALKIASARMGVSTSEYVAGLIHEFAKTVKLDDAANEWIAAKRAENLDNRARADELTASGKYRVKHPKKRGRPTKKRRRHI